MSFSIWRRLWKTVQSVIKAVRCEKNVKRLAWADFIQMDEVAAIR